jgi:hypothetical protein
MNSQLREDTNVRNATSQANKVYFNQPVSQFEIRKKLDFSSIYTSNISISILI